MGDAAHLMPPAGEGANLAMLDAAELGQLIAETPENIEQAFTQYETKMFPRSQAAAAQADVFLDMLLGEDTPHVLAKTLTDTLDRE
ncbi:FAD-dependent oxidoreductase [Staphylococcus edaphicus]|uniref:FAD-dependent oxidoreductase n=1 Tax=Staphylococcus edaphicus TaxID=1955013 RepID=UPI00321F9E26